MKILYCIPSLSNSGGMEKILTEKVNWLIEQGYHVDIVTVEGSEKEPFFKLHKDVLLYKWNINFNSSYESNLIVKLVDHYIKLAKYKKKLIKLIKDNNYDIVISLGGKEIEFLSSLKINAKKICELHFSQQFKAQSLEAQHTSQIYKLIGRYQTNRFIDYTKNLDKLVVLTKEDEREWKSTNKNVVQIYNFITSSYVSEREQDLRKGINKRCIAVGRLDEQKGFDLLLKAWTKVKQCHPDWTLHIFGVGKWEEMLMSEIKKRDLINQVFLRGQSNRIVEELEESDLFILSSRYEGFPMVLLEACLTGLPIVSFDCKTGPKEIVFQNQNGYLIEMGNVNELAKYIIKLIENPDQRHTFGSNSLKIGKRFEKEIIMQKWDRLFKSLIENNKSE